MTGPARVWIGRPPGPNGFPADVVGVRFGHRIVESELPPTRDGRRVEVRCDCGRVTHAQLSSLVKATSCASCGQRRRRGLAPLPPTPRELNTDTARQMRDAHKRCPEVWVHGPAEDAGLTKEDRDWNREVRMQAVAELVELLGPMALAEVGELLDVSRERIRQLEELALPKLARVCKRRGIGLPIARSADMAETMELSA